MIRDLSTGPALTSGFNSELQTHLSIRSDWFGDERERERRRAPSVNAPRLNIALIQHFLLHVGGLQSDRLFCLSSNVKVWWENASSRLLLARASLPSPEDGLSIAAAQIKAWQTHAGIRDSMMCFVLIRRNTHRQCVTQQLFRNQLRRRKITGLLESMLCFLVPAEWKQHSFV